MNSPNQPVWTLETALPLIRDLAPMVRELNYHLMLGGSVLHAKASSKDLDLFFSPLNGYESDPQKILNLLEELWDFPRAIRDSPDYHTDNIYYWNEMVKYTVNGRRIDVFIE